jgi:hypothetical protein
MYETCGILRIESELLQFTGPFKIKYLEVQSKYLFISQT